MRQGEINGPFDLAGVWSRARLGMTERGNDPGAPSQEENAAQNWATYAVLVVDDEEGMRSFMQRALQMRVGRVDVCPSAEVAAKLVEEIHYDVLILDITLPGKSGLEWLADLRQGVFRGEVILITAFAEMDKAIAAVRAGAADFILKPFRLDALLTSLQRCFDRLSLKRENSALRREMARFSDYEGIVGSSPAIRSLVGLVKRIAPLPSTVLLQGESGTGKELVARALHDLSTRGNRPFVAVNCAAISRELIESELFGHVKGAFTGAHESREGLFLYANGGTIFLDEISELPLDLQGKLLRVLEERTIRPVGSMKEAPVDVRVVAATNRDLKREASEGRFRQDLYFRLDVFSIMVPPLRERTEDIAELVAHCQALLAPRLDASVISVSKETLACLRSYAWPGNVRELRNFVERALILGYFPLESLEAATPGVHEPGGTAECLTLEEVERRHIVTVVARVGGNRAEAARRLGVSRKTLDRKFQEWGT